jgi:hypothetical protein
MNLRAAATALLLAFCTDIAVAQEPQPGFDTRHLQFAPARDKADACWLRRYTAEHLASHPQQRVEAIGFCVKVQRIPPDKAGEPVRFRYNFDFAAKLKGRPRPAATSGECGWAYAEPGQVAATGASIGCNVECDGGGITVEPRKGGSELLIRLENRIRVQGGCGGDDDEENAFDLTGGRDDKLFLLPKATRTAYRGFARR